MLPRFSAIAANIHHLLRARPAVVVVALAAVVWAVFARSAPGDDFYHSYRDLVLAADPYSSRVVFNPVWLAPVLAPFVTLPGRAGLLALNAATLAMLIYSVRVLGGRPVPLLLSAQVMWLLWWGQVDAVAIFGLALGVVALERRSWPLACLGLVLALTKPQVGLAGAAVIWWQLGRDRWKCLGVIGALVAVTILIWDWWPAGLLRNVLWVARAGPKPYLNTSAGLLALPLAIPGLLARLEPRRRMLALTAALQLASPYLPFYSTVAVLCFELPWWAYAFAFVGYLPLLTGIGLGWSSIGLLPLLVLAWIYLPPLQPRVLAWLQRARRMTQPQP